MRIQHQVGVEKRNGKMVREVLRPWGLRCIVGYPYFIMEFLVRVVSQLPVLVSCKCVLWETDDGSRTWVTATHVGCTDHF